MRALVVYESMWGNTEEVAKAIARGLGDGVECLDVAGDVPADLTELELLVLGGPTHAFSMSRDGTRADALTKGARPGHEGRGIREWLASLPPSEGLSIATFDTRVEKVRRLPGSAAKRAGREVRKNHLGRLVEARSFYVEDLAGPLVEGELVRAEAWGGSLAGVA